MACEYQQAPNYITTLMLCHVDTTIDPVPSHLHFSAKLLFNGSPIKTCPVRTLKQGSARPEITTKHIPSPLIPHTHHPPILKFLTNRQGLLQATTLPRKARTELQTAQFPAISCSSHFYTQSQIPNPDSSIHTSNVMGCHTPDTQASCV